MRTDGSGREFWRRTYGGPGIDRAFYAVATRDGGFIVAGVTGPRDAYDMLIFKVDAAGNELWRQVVGGKANDPNHGINLLPDGRIVVVGYTASWSSSEHDLLAVALSPRGELLSQELLGAPGDDRVINSVTARDGSTWLIGSTTSFSGGDWDILLARLTPEGRFEPWLGAIGTEFDDYGTTLLQTAEGDFLLGGYTDAASGSDHTSDWLLLRLEPNSLEHHSEPLDLRTVPSAPSAEAPVVP